jgi:AraC-like DNA-binding protein
MAYAEQSQLKRTFYSTSHVTPAQRARTLRRRLRSIADLRTEGEKSLNASLASYELGSLLVTCFTSDAAEFIRNEQVIGKSKLDEYFLLLLLLRGDIHGAFENRTFVLKRGDICVMDLSKTARLQTSACQLTGVLIRRDVLCSNEIDLHGRTLSNGRLRCRMLTAHLERLVESLSSMTVPSHDALVRTTIAVIRNCLQITQIKPEDPQPWLDILRRRILSYIEDHLTDVDLDATHIRRAFRISRSHLYRLFPEYGGIQRYIRTLRLDFALRTLCEDPDQRIAWVAEQSGFTNERQFQRAFLKRFEMTPSELRQRQRLEPVTSPRLQ